MGLLADEQQRCVLNGDEFLHLYLRFLYEIRKYGEVSKSVILGKGPPTPFGEKSEKLVTSLAWQLQRGPGIQMFFFHPYDRGTGDVIGTIRKRFAILESALKRDVTPNETVMEALSDCFSICQFVNTQRTYYLVCLSVRNLEDPRELMQIELYFDPQEEPIVITSSTLQLVKNQANEARILIEAYDDFAVTLPDLSTLLNALGGPTLDQLGSQLDPISRWYINSIQHLVRQDTLTKYHGDQSEDQIISSDWAEKYKKGDLEDAENDLTNQLDRLSEPHKAARIYNDRGYIRYGLGKTEEAKKDLQRAIDFHYRHLPLTLLDLSIIDIDEGDFDAAIDKIQHTLLLTVRQEQVEASYLRTRVPSGHLNVTRKEKLEMYPANVIEAAYINLAYCHGVHERHQEAAEALQEGLTIIPSSIRLKHALARHHVLRKRADLADPIYEALAESSINEADIANEVRRYMLQFIQRRKKKKGR